MIIEKTEKEGKLWAFDEPKMVSSKIANLRLRKKDKPKISLHLLKLSNFSKIFDTICISLSYRLLNSAVDTPFYALRSYNT